MTTDTHLDKILAFCRSRLALAEKRTPGLWYAGQYGMAVYSRHNRSSTVTHTEKSCGDAAFIAACAGAAEAGWRATLAAISAFRRQPAPEGTYHPDNPLFVEDAHAIAAILAAYPPELLTP